MSHFSTVIEAQTLEAYSTSARRCLTVWNSLMLILGVFFLYIVVVNWIDAFEDGDFRKFGVSLFLLILIVFSCWRSRSALVRRTHRNALRIIDINIRTGVSEQAGVPENIRSTFELFKMEGNQPEPQQTTQTQDRNSDNNLVDNVDVDESSSDCICAICLSEYLNGESLCRLPCPSHHVYHKDCIYHWLENHRVCPYCKFDLVSGATNNESNA